MPRLLPRAPASVRACWPRGACVYRLARSRAIGSTLPLHASDSTLAAGIPAPLPHEASVRRCLISPIWNFCVTFRQARMLNRVYLSSRNATSRVSGGGPVMNDSAQTMLEWTWPASRAAHQSLRRAHARHETGTCTAERIPEKTQGACSSRAASSSCMATAQPAR